MASILLVDDNVQFRKVLSLALKEAGHTVTEAADGKQALKLVPTTAIDVVVADIVMPEHDGMELLTQLGKNHPSLPIIAISGDSPRFTDLFLKTAKRLGAAHVLRKPFKVDELLATIASLPAH